MLMLKLMPTLPGVTPFTNLREEKRKKKKTREGQRS